MLLSASSSDLAPKVVAGFAALYFAFLLIKRLFSRAPLPLPPGPKKLPIIGNIHQVQKKKQFLQFYEWSKRHGPVMSLSMGGQPLIILSTTQAAQDLLAKRSAKYSDRPKMVMAGELVTKGMHMLIRPYDDSYKLHQRLEASLLKATSSETYLPIQDLESKQFLVGIMQNIHDPNGVDFHKHVERVVASVVYTLCFGYRLRTGDEQELQDAVRIQNEFATKGQYGRALAPWKKDGEDLFQLQYKLHISNLEKGKNNPGWNFTKNMLASNNPPAKKMSLTEIAFDVGLLADAGLETSTIAMCWFGVAWVLYGKAGWIAKAQRILDEVVGRDRLPTFEHRPKLAYIEAILSETLRWRPIAMGGVPHATKVPDVYNGYRIPAGSIVVGNHFAITREESVFGSDPDSFIPDRWVAKDETISEKDGAAANTKLKDLPQTGFGFGRRVCTGRNIARNSLFIILARLLWAYDVEGAVTNKGEDLSLDDLECSEGFVTAPQHYNLKFKLRDAKAGQLIAAIGDTWDVDHSQLLDQIGAKRTG
ncbi:cytochrome p450 [Fusarium langsethiae]|uniref:Cytochrome p450 n=1 Tax=Fusarium langsethiae TaxID=179993 RepID=A0A0M9ES49_FUSLA|nr:cytochrome p450 [Fusarium langsethiae]